MVLSKCAVSKFSNTSFDQNEWTLNRGFATLELKANPTDNLPCASIIGTHLAHGTTKKDAEIRKRQVEQIVDFIEGSETTLSTILTGDLNIERESKELEVLSKFEHGYKGKEQTATNELIAQWDLKKKEELHETIDYMSLYRNDASDATSSLQGCELVKAFDESYNTRSALSDHHALIGHFKINSTPS